MVDLRNLFCGFIQAYRSLNLRFSPRYESMAQWTLAEIGWFARLGECLGYHSVVEKDVFRRGRPADLVWVDQFSSEVILHLERENVSAKIAETIEKKLLPVDGKSARLCIGIFDELRDECVAQIAELTEARLSSSKSLCQECLMICYSHIPSSSAAGESGRLRYQMEWEVKGLHLVKGKEKQWLEARCTTDANHFYSMSLIKPRVQAPYKRGHRAV